MAKSQVTRILLKSLIVLGITSTLVGSQRTSVTHGVERTPTPPATSAAGSHSKYVLSLQVVDMAVGQKVAGVFKIKVLRDTTVILEKETNKSGFLKLILPRGTYQLAVTGKAGLWEPYGSVKVLLNSNKQIKVKVQMVIGKR